MIQILLKSPGCMVQMIFLKSPDCMLQIIFLKSPDFMLQIIFFRHGRASASCMAKFNSGEERGIYIKLSE